MSVKTDLQGFDISQKKAALIGCGGLGCHIGTHLACAGIGTLYLCDDDTVSESNLNRQFLYTAADIGKKKAPLMQNRLRSLSHESRFEYIEKRIAETDDLRFAYVVDIVFSAVDNNETRRVIEAYCALRNLPLVNGGINGFFGTAYLWIPGKTPDLSRAGLLQANNPRPRSVTTAVGMIGALEAQLGIRYLTGDTAAAGYLHVYDGEEIQKLKIH